MMTARMCMAKTTATLPVPAEYVKIPLRPKQILRIMAMMTEAKRMEKAPKGARCRYR